MKYAEWVLCDGPGVKPFPAPPSRDTLLTGQLTGQGITIHTTEFGDMPWWPGCWAWLSPQSRKEAAQQLIAHGDQLMLLSVPSGKPLYDEPDQFYSPDKFPALSITPDGLVELVAETIQLGFKGVWLFLGGDDGQNGFPIAISQSQQFGPAMKKSKYGDLNQYTVTLPGWDGVWHKPNSSGTGYTPQQIRMFSLTARQYGAQYVGIEQGTGYMLAGEGGNDYQPGGTMSAYDLVLLEFEDNSFDDNVWQILGRLQRPYIRPAEQPADDDPNPPYVLEGTNVIARVFEYFMYGAVRGTPNSVIAGAKGKFEAMGAQHVC
jgi:hypothetical protein